jgi:predicted S18 family serine protease
MVSHFKNFSIQLIKGDSIVEEIKNQYVKIYEDATTRLSDAQKRLDRGNFEKPEYKESALHSLEYAQKRFEEAKNQLERFVQVDENRIISIYNCKLKGLKKYRCKNEKYTTIKLVA